MQRPEFHPLDRAQVCYEPIGLANGAMEIVSPFNLILKIAVSGVLEFAASLMPMLAAMSAPSRF